MLNQILTVLVYALILYLVYIIAGLIISALGLPGVILTIVGILLLIAFIYKIIKMFGISL